MAGKEEVSLDWFMERIGKTVLRNNKPFKIENKKYAEHLYTIQDGYEFKDA